MIACLYLYIILKFKKGGVDLVPNISMSSLEFIDTLCDTLNDGICALRVLGLEGSMHKKGLRNL